MELTLIKEREESGWGYSYLRKWLPDCFGIPCGKHDKQQAILQVLRELKIIHQRVASNMGRATGWTLGKRARARMAGDHTDDWKKTDLSAESLQRRGQATALLEGTNYQMQLRERERRMKGSTPGPARTLYALPHDASTEFLPS